MRKKYIVDSSNRLIIKRKGRRILADGIFDTDVNNRLIYWLNEPSAWRRKYSLSGKLTFLGKWQLSQDHDLELMLSDNNELMTIKGEIISVRGDALVFAFISEDKQGLKHLRILKLSGSWQADEHNRLNFLVERKARPDTLLLKGAWQINKNQQLVYAYEKTDLIRKTKSRHTLSFEGFWRIDGANRLVYVLERSANSAFAFRVQAESPNLYPKAGEIKYRVGIGLKGKDSFQEKIISLFGSWKFSGKGGLDFEMDYGNNRLQKMEFGAQLNFTEKDQVSLSLTNRQKEPIGLNITFTHKFLRKNCAETFLRLKKLKKESAIEGGVKIVF